MGADVVLDLLSVVKNKNSHNIFFDNFFSSYKLMTVLKHNGYFATGTIRDNRTDHCTLDTVKTVAKRNRGSYSSAFEESNGISLLRWNDNSVVTLISTHYHVEPVQTAKRFDRTAKRMENISQPAVVFSYNKYMGGVDLHDNGIANYRSRVLGKKWWWPLFVNTLDSAIVNAWKIYNYVNEKKMSQVDFKSYIALRLLKSEAKKAKSDILTVPNEIRTDQSGHLIIQHELKTRRRCKVCHSQTIYMCKRCNVHIHTNCFQQYHTK